MIFIGRVVPANWAYRLEPRPSQERASGWQGTVSFVPGRARAWLLWSCFGPAQIARPRWSGIVAVHPLLIVMSPSLTWTISRNQDHY
jgi:hypothetical protein